jgi:hypothetical protein
MPAVVYDAAGHRRSPVTMPGFHEAVLRETRAGGIQRTRPPSRRSSRSCATPAAARTALGCGR